MSAVVRATRTRQLGGAIGIVLSVCVISGLHYTLSMHAILVHEILKRLYYVPIVVAAIRYGAQGGIATALLASALFLLHIVMSWSNWPVFEVGQYGEIILFNVIGAVTGIMADRLRAEGNRYRQASEALAAAYEQLKVNTDHRLKSERMATVGPVSAGMANEIPDRSRDTAASVVFRCLSSAIRSCSYSRALAAMIDADRQRQLFRFVVAALVSVTERITLGSPSRCMIRPNRDEDTWLTRAYAS